MIRVFVSIIFSLPQGLNLKITMLIESLGSGGAERQMCLMAVEMQRRGHEVQLVTYYPDNFYAPLLEHTGVKHTFLGGEGTLQWLLRIRRFLRTNQQDVVLAFLESCASYAELAALPFRSWGLVVSERSAFLRLPKGSRRLRKWFHLLADAVTTNSHTNRLMLEAMVPLLKSRTITIYNAVDLDKFKPGTPVAASGQVRLVTAARFNKQKNVLRTIEAFDLLRQRRINVSVDWYGRTTDDPVLWQQCNDLIRQKNLADRFRVHESTRDILSLYQQADAVLLPSLFEGIPNVVCEAMACGKPILMSAVCDAGNLVRPGENGYLFAPDDPSDIADAIGIFASLTERQRWVMGEKSRTMAEQYFDIRKFADAYEVVLRAASRRQRPHCSHWLPDVPQTAVDFCKTASAQ